MRNPAAPLLAIALLAPAAARAQTPEVDCASLSPIDGIEDAFGPGNVNATAGNGALGAGISARGEITVLRWPTPSQYDQVDYLTPFLTEACETRKLPRHGAEANMGVFAGLAVEAAGGARETTWLRDPPWTQAQTYAHEESAVVVNLAEHSGLGLAVRTEIFVAADADVLTMRFAVQRLPGSSVESARLVLFENLAPNNTEIPYLPIQDQLFDASNDFSALYHAGRDALVHWRPAEPDAAYAAGFLDAPQAVLDAWVDGGEMDAKWGAGDRNVYFAVGADRPSAAHQVGDRNRAAPGTPTAPQDAYADATDDGDLSGASLRVGAATAALDLPLDLAAGEDAVRVLFTPAHTAVAALDALDTARARPHAEAVAALDAWWRAFLAPAPMPDVDDPDIRAFSKRALISLRQGYANATGATVAALTSQPPYAVSWPRDSVFFLHALEVAGHPELAERTARFFAGVARDCVARPDDVCRNEGGVEFLFSLFAGRLLDWPLDGTWDMAYYADGTPGGPFVFEIDNTGLMLWGLVEHARFLEEPERSGYLCGDGVEPGVWPAIEKAALAVARCRDPLNDLPCYALEDDNPVASQGLQGAITVWTGLRSAVEAGEICAADLAVLAELADRRDALAAAIEANFLATEGPGAPSYPGGGAAAWMLWPAEFPMSEEVRDNTARVLWEDVRRVMAREVAGASYQTKATLALARIGWDSGDPVYDLAWALGVLAKEIPTAGTRHLGEVWQIYDADGDGRAEFHTRTAVPHLWEQTLTYLSLVAHFGAAPPDGGGDCDCATGSRARGPGPADFADALLVALLLAGTRGAAGLARRRCRG